MFLTNCVFIGIFEICRGICKTENILALLQSFKIHCVAMNALCGFCAVER